MIISVLCVLFFTNEISKGREMGALPVSLTVFAISEFLSLFSAGVGRILVLTRAAEETRVKSQGSSFLDMLKQLLCNSSAFTLFSFKVTKIKC